MAKNQPTPAELPSKNGVAKASARRAVSDKNGDGRFRLQQNKQG
ncbi:hypothetical protein J2Y45_004112 [Dyadobacter sp. BE34]|uniref:Uncharacterized protein n=1 Tax=Dyadobacter fermentans TaxID=94254 RepID=A0ABU1R2X0_9BACT|nr:MULTISPECIES: hypothetical protein [Dyadobacter]MDR6806920.1 hypothetical protein [Dyadobacter fermentans]MDR7044662.1 hypothetical protein [Dyadobacter sp. BE242]MDR7198972.1 hypothetical protein [Dyadobacter sp. BE34]MDR7216934.1 hypothetical protein [Dyadobacter sp. BE31]MDR7263540.1 hypothetical protein [Dyadobacter sp. BE32]